MSSRLRPNFTVLIGGLLLSGAFVTLLGVGFMFNPRALPDAMTGKSTPNFVLQDLDGNTVRLKDVLGKPIVLNFWSTWCGPCKQEHPVLLEAAKLYPEVQFYGVIYQDDAEPIRNYLKRNGASYPHLVDPQSRVAINMGVAGVPETYFIDRKGIIQAKAIYPVWADYIAEQLEPMMRDTP